MSIELLIPVISSTATFVLGILAERLKVKKYLKGGEEAAKLLENSIEYVSDFKLDVSETKAIIKQAKDLIRFGQGKEKKQ